MANTKLIGSINLARLDGVGVMNIQGKTATKKCLVIPIEDNDIFIKVEEKTKQNGERYVSKLYTLGVEILEKREADQWGNVCHIKLQTSKEWIEKHTKEQLEARSGIYLGNLKAVEIPSSNQAETMEAPTIQGGADDELPF